MGTLILSNVFVLWPASYSMYPVLKLVVATQNRGLGGAHGCNYAAAGRWEDAAGRSGIRSGGRGREVVGVALRVSRSPHCTTARSLCLLGRTCSRVPSPPRGGNVALPLMRPALCFPVGAVWSRMKILDLLCASMLVFWKTVRMDNKQQLVALLDEAYLCMAV